MCDMPRIARVVVPGQPHHLTQRSVRSTRVFFSDEDRQTYLDLVTEQFEAHDVEARAWYLMTNHIRLIAVPATEDGLAAAIGQVHQRCTALSTSARRNAATCPKAGSTHA